MLVLCSKLCVPGDAKPGESEPFVRHRPGEGSVSLGCPRGRCAQDQWQLPPGTRRPIPGIASFSNDSSRLQVTQHAQAYNEALLRASSQSIDGHS